MIDVKFKMNVDPATVFKFAGVDSNAIYLINQQNSFI